jgi:ribosome-associated toxin RatA of RatAB toxin-antitoxin module
MKGLMLLILLVLFVSGPASAREKPDTDTFARLERGEVVAEEARGDEAGGAAHMLILVRAPARAVWDVIVSCEKAFVFVEGLRQCEIQADRGNTVLVHQVVKQGWLVPTQDFVFESLREPYRRIGFRLVEGNLKSMRGEWRFTEVEQGTLVDYEIALQPAMPVPGFLVRRSVRKSMPDLLACVRALAGGSLSARGREEDIARCPGSAS